MRLHCAETQFLNWHRPSPCRDARAKHGLKMLTNNTTGGRVKRTSKRPTSSRRRTKTAPAKQTQPRGVSKTTTTKAGQVLTRMREGQSLEQASRDVGINRRTVERVAQSALRRQPSGRLVARSSDRLPRAVRLPFADGLRDITVKNSEQAGLIGEYWNAVHAYLATGDQGPLQRFEGATVATADGERVRLLADRATLERLGSAGVMSFESIYARMR